MHPEDARGWLGALLEQEREPPLDRCAALLAVEEQGGGDPEAMLAGLDALADRLALAGVETFEAVARLHQRLFTEAGFRGDADNYDDPQNSFLDRVLERRRGLPILLAVVYIEVARRAGLAVDGVGFPGHFLVSPRGPEPRFFVDPFAGGRVLREDILRVRLANAEGVAAGVPWERATARVGSRYILVRMTNNLKGAYFRRRHLPGVLRSVERLLLLDPGDVENLRDRGWLLLRAGRGAEAVEAYEAYLAARPDARDREEVLAEIRLARGE